MDWTRHSKTWPNAVHSTFVTAAPHRWHVQRAGDGPTILLLHGAGASTHSWASIFSELSRSHDVIAIDLPGQGFTKIGGPRRCGLRDMSKDIANLLSSLGAEPVVIIAHSAGAVIAIELSKRLTSQPGILSINGAFEAFSGVAGVLFPAIAKTLSLSPMTGVLFSMMSDSDLRVRKWIESTGSELPDEIIEYYHALIRDSTHVNATLSMMASWSLEGVAQSLSSFQSDVHFLVGGRDKAVSPRVSKDAAKRVPNSTIEVIPSLGHLMHEEDPETTLAWIRDRMGTNANTSTAIS